MSEWMMPTAGGGQEKKLAMSAILTTNVELKGLNAGVLLICGVFTANTAFNGLRVGVC